MESLRKHFATAIQAAQAGNREFQENLASYPESKTPVAITRHGSTICIYIHTRPKRSQADLEALGVAGEKMQELVAAAADDRRRTHGGFQETAQCKARKCSISKDPVRLRTNRKADPVLSRQASVPSIVIGFAHGRTTDGSLFQT